MHQMRESPDGAPVGVAEIEAGREGVATSASKRASGELCPKRRARACAAWLCALPGDAPGGERYCGRMCVVGGWGV